MRANPLQWGRAVVLTGLCGVFAGCVDLGPLLRRDLVETTVQEYPGWFVTDKILLVDISGEILDADGGLFGGLVCTPEYVKAVLNRAEKDPTVRAVVLRIDSPGGSVGASEVIAREIKAFRTRTGLPVMAQINNMGCSGAYFVACAADRIQAQPSAIVGSIGVIASLPKYRKLADKIGYEQQVFKSGAMKDIGSGMRDMTEEERAVIQQMIDGDYRLFLDWILANRPKTLTREALTAAADGRIFTPQDAVERKLIDGIGFLDEAIQLAMTAAHVRRADVVTYGYSDSADRNIFSPRGAVNPLHIGALGLPPILGERKSGFYFLWMP